MKQAERKNILMYREWNLLQALGPHPDKTEEEVRVARLVDIYNQCDLVMMAEWMRKCVSS